MITTRATASILFTLLAINLSSLAQSPQVEVHHLDQNWNEKEIQWFYHINQGTVLMPYDWFLALEQPETSGKLFRENDYMAGFGFLPNPNQEGNPDGLPVGFAKATVPVKPGEPKEYDAVGFTCAACHTGQINYKGIGIRVNGGPGMFSSEAFGTQSGRAIFETWADIRKFKRFAKKVLGQRYPEGIIELRAQLDVFLIKVTRGAVAAALDQELSSTRGTKAGFGRVAAIGAGGNRLLSYGGVNNPRNYAALTAPVSYPALWDTPFFDWVQYNAAIRQPMARNSIEALGVGVPVTLKGPKENLYKSSLPVENLYLIEESLKQLKSPTWPGDILPPIDTAKAAEGRKLYRKYCERCHALLEKRGEPRPITVTLVSLDTIGTDPNTATGFFERQVITGDLGLGTVKYFDALRILTTEVLARRYEDLNIPPERQEIMNGGRPNDWRAPLAYRARPHNGIWATAPFLHNGSVPNLYQMLIPAHRRDKTFYVGNLDFDPRHVGFETKEFEGGFKFDTTISGNSNAGHEFRNAPLGNGVIGPELTDTERWNIIEFLKTL